MQHEHSTEKNREGPRKVPWQRQFRDKGFPLQLQFDSLGCVVNSQNSRGFRQAGEPKNKISIENPKDVVHENPYARSNVVHVKQGDEWIVDPSIIIDICVYYFK